MPKIEIIVNTESGKLELVSQAEVNGGPPDNFIAVRSNRDFKVFQSKDEAKLYIENGGQVYWVTHYYREDRNEWLPKSYPLERYDTH